MEVYFTISSVFQIIVTVLGLAVAVVFWNHSDRQAVANRLLSFSLFCISIWSTVSLLGKTQLILKFPHLYHTEHFFGLLYLPFSYLYVRSVIERKPVATSDLIHLAPAILFFVDYVPFYSLSMSEKTNILQRDLLDPHQINGFNGWIFGESYALLLRTTVMALYWFFQASLLWKFYSSDIRSQQIESKTWRQWLSVYTTLQFFSFAPYFLLAWLGDAYAIGFIGHLAIAASVTFTAFYLFRRPEILYGLSFHTLASNRSISEQALVATLLEVDAVHSGNGGSNKIDIPRGEEILELLKKIMEEDRPYLLQRYSILDLSNDLKLPVYQVAALLNTLMGLSFRDYLNQQRVFHCQQRMKRGHAEHLELATLAAECGFSNLDTFTSAFKRFTSTDPSDYLKSLKASGSFVRK